MTLQHALISTALALAALASQAQTTAGTVKVEAPWARPTVQGQAAGGGFLRIVGGAADDKLVAASAPVAGRVELHSMTMDGDIMRMRQISTIAVPAGKTIDLKPGGLHVMFMDLKAPLQKGASFPLTLKFEKAGNVQVEVQIQPAPPAGPPAMKNESKHEHKH
jgi:periplasmic copper chaperone A